jgi:hypothetical protein
MSADLSRSATVASRSNANGAPSVSSLSDGTTSTL